MPQITRAEAVDCLAVEVEKVHPAVLIEIDSELFPQRQSGQALSRTELVAHIRSSLYPEEIVDLWNVVFPADQNVWYDEEEEALHFNHDVADYVDAD